jgi:hypothetical protein
MASDLLSTIRSEIEARLNELRPSLAEYERLLVAAEALAEGDGVPVPPAVTRAPRAVRARPATRGSTADAAERMASAVPGETPKPRADVEKPKPARAQRGAAREAILAALDHGSHTVSELVVVTAMSAPNINGSLRRLVSEKAVIKTEREGKRAYALPAVV